ncbi:MAG TPA: EAL domain-containing protein [Steroidobacteraceae bacterium]|nr:EAL domain-containing protein [Steroidobacteraceae bacterium]
MVKRLGITIVLSTLVPVLALVGALSGSAAGAGAWRWLLIGGAAALLSAAAAVAYLARRYQPALAALHGGFQDLAATGFAQVPAAGHDELGALIREFNQCAQRVRAQQANLETLGEVDKLLLQPGGLEPVLEAILTRVQRVTGCSSAGIVLRDHDAPWRGRVYLAAKSCRDLPVSRVALDDDMMVTLAAEPEALTVTRCEDTRHSFLVPLKELGAEFFWVWPVKLAAHLTAILAVGYQEMPVADPHIGHCGSEFAARLGFALTKAARDEQLYRQAHFDPLTGLPNRVLFCSRLSVQLQSAAAGLEKGAVLYIDLDHFKKINDTVGHAAGDQVLSIAAQRLRGCVKEIDTVARLGGDEFAVILRDVVSAEAVEYVAQRIVQSLQQPVSLGGRDHTVCASIGIALFPQDGEAIDTLLRNADTAMYRAKDLGRSRAMFYDVNMGGQQPLPSESGLQLALRRREFSLFYQPQYSITDGSLTGLEALLRWQTQREGVRQPGDFVPAAEESGLIVDIGGWVLETACAQLAAWREQGLSPPRLALNVSLQQLRHPEFVRNIRKMLDRFGLPGEILELDIDERVLADPANAALLERLAQTGVCLALDGFGTGYSSLGYLRQHPISVVKIDRSFLANVPQDPNAATLIETVIVMAHALQKRVVAEGIETIEQLDFLRERRCDCAQGYYLARPLPAASVTELLSSRVYDNSAEDARAAG